MVIKIAYENIIRHKRRSLLTFSLLSVAVLFYITMKGLMVGLLDSSIDNIIELDTGHIKVFAPDYDEDFPYSKDNLFDTESIEKGIKSIEHVKGVTSRYLVQADIDNGYDMLPIVLTGIDFQTDQSVFDIKNYITGDLDLEKTKGAWLGASLAHDMDILVDDTMYLTFKNIDGGYLSLPILVQGLLSSPDPKSSASGVFVDKTMLEEFMNTSKNNEIIVKLDNRDYADTVKSQIQKMYPTLTVKTWLDLSGDLESVNDMKMLFVNGFIFVFVLIAGIGLVNTLMLSVFERQRELAMLKALGFENKNIIEMVLWEGVMICVAGVLAGLILGAIINGILTYTGIDFSSLTVDPATGEPMDIGYVIIGSIYPAWNIWWFVEAFAFSILLGLIASIYPAKKAAHMQVVDALRKLN